MIRVDVGRPLNPFEESAKWLGASGIKVKISQNSIEVHGNMEKDFISNITSLDIARMTNEKMQQQTKKREEKFEENGRYTSFRRNLDVNEQTAILRRPKKGEVWEVDFGQPLGSEFGYCHPAIVLRKSSTNECFVVLPCSSKEKEGWSYQIKFTKDTLKDANLKFLEDAENKLTHIMFDQQDAIDKLRFKKYLGTLDELVFQDILKELYSKEEEVKREISLEDMNLTEPQRKILELTDRDSDLIGIANNENFSYEQRVRGLLMAFGFNVNLGGDVDFLVNLIKNTRTRTSYIDIHREAEILARGTILNPQTINHKLIELTKKRFKEVHPCLLEFVSLVNKLAS